MGRLIPIVIGALFCGALLMAQSNMFWSQNQPKGLVGWWKLCGDKTMGGPCAASSSTSVADSSGNGNNGTWSGTAAGTTGYYSAGKVGPWAGAFNGVTTTGTVLTATVAGTISQFTLSEWVYLTSTNSGYTIVAKFGGTSIYPISSNGGPQLRIVDNSFAANPNTFGSTTSGFWLNTWHLFTVTEDGATVRVYIDGALSASSPMSNPGASVTNPVLQIGNLYSGRDLIGYVDDVRVYNRALTAGEIAGLYLATVPAPAYVQEASSISPGCFTGVACSTAAMTTTTGHALKVEALFESTTTLPTITDTCGTSSGGSNTYTAAASNTGNYVKAASFYTLVGYGKSCVVSATFATGTGYQFVKVTEIAGVNQTTPVVSGQWSINVQYEPGSGTAAINAGSVTTTQGNTYLQVDTADANSGNDVWSAGSGFTLQSTGFDGVVFSFAGEGEALAAPGSVIGSFTSTTGATGYYVTDAMVFQHQ